MSTIGTRIASILLRHGDTAERAAERIGVSPKTISRWIHDRTDIGAAYIIAICTIYNVSADYLLGLDNIH